MELEKQTIGNVLSSRDTRSRNSCGVSSVSSFVGSPPSSTSALEPFVGPALDSQEDTLVLPIILGSGLRLPRPGC